VTLKLQNAIQEPSTRKAFLARRRDESWEKAAQRAFGFPIKFDTEAQFVEENHVLACLADFEAQIPRQLKEGSLHVSPRTPLSFPIGIKVVFNDQTADITIQNNTPVSRVEAMLSIRWGVQVQFAPNQSLVWAPNKRFEFISTIPGQRAALTEEMRARMAADAGPQKWRMCFSVVDDWSRYPVEIAADATMSWDQILELWYQKAITVSGWDTKKYPRDSSAYMIKNVDGKVIEHMDGVTVAFAYYIPSMKGSTPTQPKRKKTLAPPAPQTKPIVLKVIAMTSGEVISLPNISHYDEAIPSATTPANIPESWTVTVIENNPSGIMVACAPPEYGLITPEKYREVCQRQASELTAIPKTKAVPRLVMVVVTYVHLTPHRKLDRMTYNFRVEEDDSKQILLGEWIRLARESGKEPWPKIARKMSGKVEDY
jgi:hypothetical protein